MLNLHRNIYFTTAVMSLNFLPSAMMVLISGLIGNDLAPSSTYATLPLAVMVVGSACSSIPAALFMQKFGRKWGMSCGIITALLGSGIAIVSIQYTSFWLFLIASFCLGINLAFTMQGRFIILENATTKEQAANGLTLALLANLLSAFLGPLIGTEGMNTFYQDSGFSGSFVLLAFTQVFALILSLQYQEQEHIVSTTPKQQRPALTILSEPKFILAAGSGAIAYAVMSFIMTATPISMHEHQHHSIDSTRFVIQSHIIAMFLPSILSGFLLKRSGANSLIFLGLALYFVVIVIGLFGQSVPHYWWALVLLGLGWNLLFMSATTMLPNSYEEQDRFKAQAINDFIIFSAQAIASFAAGWALFAFSWQGVLTCSFILSLLWLIASIYLAHKTKNARHDTR